MGRYRNLNSQFEPIPYDGLDNLDFREIISIVTGPKN